MKALYLCMRFLFVPNLKNWRALRKECRKRLPVEHKEAE